MKIPLKILMIDDSEDDVLLVARHLEQCDLAVEWERVDTADGMCAALQRSNWDAIICDFMMPGFGPAAALAIVRELKSEIPVIIISGKMTEDRLVNLMRQGAHDVVLKDNLTRLLPALKRGISGTERHRAERKMEIALRLEIEEARALYNKTPAMLHTLDGEGRIIAVSDAWLDYLEYDRATVLGRPLSEFMIEVPWMQWLLRSGRCAETAFRFKKRNGGAVNLLMSAVAEMGPDGLLRRSFAVLTESDHRVPALSDKESELMDFQPSD